MIIFKHCAIHTNRWSKVPPRNSCFFLRKMNTPVLRNDFQEAVPTLNYSYTFNFERNFDASLKQQWMKEHWHYAFYYSGIYILLVFGGKAYMLARPKFELRKTLAVWNILLAVFSIIGLSRTLPEMIFSLQNYGLTYSVCDASYAVSTKVTAFWGFLFCMSKVLELGDTIFIVLRKQQLIFLHWYHHIFVLLYTWYYYQYNVGAGRWYCVMNFAAHSMMYTYFAMRAMRIKVPKFIPITITSVQLLQMFIGFFVTCYAYIKSQTEDFCDFPSDSAKFAMLMYGSYFALFGHFFYNTYISSNAKQKKQN